MRTPPNTTSLAWVALSVLSACSAPMAKHVEDASAVTADVIPDRPTDPRSIFLIPDIMEDIGVDSRCGDGYRDRDEECDDGNTLSNDGCSSLCQFEDPWPPGCPAGGCERKTACGDGRLTSNEVCDDGDHQDGDGCSADCQTIEPHWRCRVPGRRCTPSCGDRALSGTETCDDGNTSNGDGCSAYCLTEPGWKCSGDTCAPLAAADGGTGTLDGSMEGGPGHLRCGDGVLSGAEECDLGDLNANGVYGGCNTSCFYDSFCGDGIVNGSEECDLGKANGSTTYGNRGGCTLGCTNVHYCGDGLVDATLGEECDLGEKNGRWLDSDLNPVDDGAPGTTKLIFCTTDCILPLCCGYH